MLPAKRKKKASVLEWGINLIEQVFPTTFDPDHDPCFSKLEKPVVPVAMTKKEQWLLRKKGLVAAKPVEKLENIGLVIPDHIPTPAPKTANQLLQQHKKEPLRELDMEEIDRRTAEMDLENPGSGSLWKHRVIKDYEAQQRIQVAKTFANASAAERLAMSSGGNAYMSGMDVFSHCAFEGSEFISDLGNIPCSLLDGKVGRVMDTIVPAPQKPMDNQSPLLLKSIVLNKGHSAIGQTCPITWDVFSEGDEVFITPCCKKVLSASVLEGGLTECPCCHVMGDFPKPK